MAMTKREELEMMSLRQDVAGLRARLEGQFSGGRIAISGHGQRRPCAHDHDTLSFMFGGRRRNEEVTLRLFEFGDREDPSFGLDIGAAGGSSLVVEPRATNRVYLTLGDATCDRMIPARKAK